MVLLRKIDDAILRRAGGAYQCRQLGQRVDRDEDGPRGQRRTGHPIRHPDRNGGRALIGLAEPHLVALPHAALYENRLAVQRMPGIVNGDLLSVVGRM
jgi:hypothetical protein